MSSDKQDAKMSLEEKEEMEERTKAYWEAFHAQRLNVPSAKYRRPHGKRRHLMIKVNNCLLVNIC